MPSDELPPRLTSPENTGHAQTAVGAADGIEIDNGIPAVISELRQGKAKDQSFSKRSFPIGQAISFGEEQRIRLPDTDAHRLFKPLLLPEIRESRKIGLFRKFIERNERDLLLQIILLPFFIIIFYKAAGVCADNKIIMVKSRVYDGVIDFIDEVLRCRGLRRRHMHGPQRKKE